jgi:hypothetical protein
MTSPGHEADLAIIATSLLKWAPAASGLFAACAAAASWAAVRLNYRQWRASRLPELRIQGWHKHKTGKIEFIILNAGAGVARGVGFCVVFGEEYVSGFAGPNFGGFLNPGERVTVETDLTPGSAGEYQGVVTCDDVVGCYHSWSIRPVQHRVWRTRVLHRPLKDYPSGETVLKRHHPDIDLSVLRRVSGRAPASQFGLT